MKPRDAVGICARAADRIQAEHDRGVILGNLRTEDVLEGRFEPAPAEPDSLRPGHRSPERIFSSPEEVDARTDVYSLGSVLYELLTGRAPFDDADLALALKRLELEDPAPPGVSKAVDAVVLRALAKEPSARFATARDFAAALRTASPRPKAWLFLLAAAPVALFLATLPTPPSELPRPTAPTDPRVPWLADLAVDPPDLFPAVRDLALRVGVEADPARLGGEILGRVGPMIEGKPASAGPYALLGVAHRLHGNLELARECFARARERLAPDAPLDRDPLGRMIGGARE